MGNFTGNEQAAGRAPTVTVGFGQAGLPPGATVLGLPGPQWHRHHGWPQRC